MARLAVFFWLVVTSLGLKGPRGAKAFGIVPTTLGGRSFVCGDSPECRLDLVSRPRLKSLTSLFASKNGDEEESFEDTLGGFRYHRLNIDGSQNVDRRSSEEKLVNWIEGNSSQRGNRLTDVWVISHGWRYDPTTDAAKKDYKTLFENVEAVCEDRLREREFGIVGITWPSKEIAQGKDFFADIEALQLEYSDCAEALERVKVKGEALQQLGVDMNTIFAKGAVTGQSDEVSKARIDFGLAIRDLGKPITAGVEAGMSAESLISMYSIDELEETFFGLEDRKRRPFSFLRSSGASAKLIPDPEEFAPMKVRAYLTGINAVSPLLSRIRSQTGVNFHLVGHSFGGLLVSAAAYQSARRGDYASLTVLQGAYSAHSFRKSWQGGSGMFRDVVKQGSVSGPVAVSYTDSDWALGFSFLYPRSARIGGFDGSQVPSLTMAKEDSADRWNAIGNAGALEESEEFVTTKFHWSPAKIDLVDGKINNLEPQPRGWFGTHPINGHLDVWNRNVANLLVEVAQTRPK